jgi:CheY-like chemotaxis protein
MTTVLVVDDEWDIRELLVDTILDAGLEVIEAGDGKTALERANKDHPDLILLDVWMPGMDGFEVLGKLRGKPQHRKCTRSPAHRHACLRRRDRRAGHGGYPLH